MKVVRCQLMAAQDKHAGPPGLRSAGERTADCLLKSRQSALLTGRLPPMPLALPHGVTYLGSDSAFDYAGVRGSEPQHEGRNLPDVEEGARRRLKKTCSSTLAAAPDRTVTTTCLIRPPAGTAHQQNSSAPARPT